MRRSLILAGLLVAACPTAPPAGVCGDSFVDVGESCDDGNTVSGDGCDASCQQEPPCGNGLLEGNEACDDGNNLAGDGCDPLCQLEPACGDGALDAGEQCDDGNKVDGDGCSAVCLLEGGPLCGDGVVEAPEQCDDGNQLSNDGCSAACQGETIAAPLCDPPVDKDGYRKTTCRYERLHTAGTFPLDVYTPLSPTTDAPVLFFIHGGGWSTGSRGEAEPAMANLARQGAVGVSIDYELRPAPQLGVQNDLIDSTEEMSFQRDAAAAFAWTRQHISGFGGDPNHVVVSGHSAGGHMATLLTAQKAWVVEAFLAAGLLAPEQVEGFRVSSVVKGLINLSGPLDLNTSQRNFAGFLGLIIDNIWSPAMFAEGSPLTHFALEQDAPPMLHVSGGGAGLGADTEGIISAQIDYTREAHALGLDATFLHPLFESKSFSFGFPFQDFNGHTCFSQLQHGDTAILLGQDFVPMALDQKFFETRPDVCNAQTLLGVFVGLPGYRDAILDFLVDPEGELGWVTPGFSLRSIPNVAPSPLLIGAASGVLPAQGQAWSANPRLDPAHGIVFVSNPSFDLSGVATSAGAPVPEGIFDFQLLAAAGGPSLEVHAPVPPGDYRVNLYFGEMFAERFVDVTAEGVSLGTNISSLAGALLKAKKVEFSTVVTVDSSFDLVLQRSPGTNQNPMLAGVELVPVP